MLARLEKIQLATTFREADFVFTVPFMGAVLLLCYSFPHPAMSLKPFLLRCYSGSAGSQFVLVCRQRKTMTSSGETEGMQKAHKEG